MSPQPIPSQAIIRETLVPFQTTFAILDRVPPAKHGLDVLIEVHKAILSQQHPYWGQFYSLSYLGVARGFALAGDAAKAKRAFQDFFELWKDADPDIPILPQARAEYTKLR